MARKLAQIATACDGQINHDLAARVCRIDSHDPAISAAIHELAGRGLLADGQLSEEAMHAVRQSTNERLMDVLGGLRTAFDIPSRPLEAAASVGIASEDDHGKAYLKRADVPNPTDTAVAGSTACPMHPVGRTTFPTPVVARMPDGSDVVLVEKTDRSSAGEVTARRGEFVFDDPKTKYQHGKGRFEFDGQIRRDAVDLQNIFNNSHKKGALALAIWHMTKGADQPTFKVSGIASDDVVSICQSKYEMRPGAEDEMVGSLKRVRELARENLVRNGWKLAD
jgi:hypothetical protein